MTLRNALQRRIARGLNPRRPQHQRTSWRLVHSEGQWVLIDQAVPADEKRPIWTHTRDIPPHARSKAQKWATKRLKEMRSMDGISWERVPGTPAPCWAARQEPKD